MNKTILYDFPKLPSQKINSIFSGNIQYSVAGKENQPNISVVKKSQKRGFVSKNVYIFSNIHNVSGESDPCTGELVIEHLFFKDFRLLTSNCLLFRFRHN